MRLSERQKEALYTALEEADLPEDSAVYLFGSRVDPHKRGGDIDLLVYVRDVDAENLRRRIRRAFEAHLAEKIDILVIDPSKDATDASRLAATVDKERIR